VHVPNYDFSYFILWLIACFNSVLQFLSSNFVVMLFHYDGMVNEWKDFEWNNRVIHISALNQTKW
jgi:hypothetical protein